MAEEVEEHIDTIAERIAQLGGIANGTIQEVQRATTSGLSDRHLRRLRAGPGVHSRSGLAL